MSARLCEYVCACVMLACVYICAFSRVCFISTGYAELSKKACFCNFRCRKNQIKEENNLSTVTTGEENQKTKGQQSESVTSERSDDINKPSEQLSLV